MLALGSLKDLIIQKMQDNCLQFDIIGFIRNIVVEDLNATGISFVEYNSLENIIVKYNCWLKIRFYSEQNKKLFKF